MSPIKVFKSVIVDSDSQSTDDGQTKGQEGNDVKNTGDTGVNNGSGGSNNSNNVVSADISNSTTNQRAK